MANWVSDRPHIFGKPIPQPGEHVQLEGVVASWSVDAEQARLSLTFEYLHKMEITKRNPDPELIGIIMDALFEYEYHRPTRDECARRIAEAIRDSKWTPKK